MSKSSVIERLQKQHTYAKKMANESGQKLAVLAFRSPEWYEASADCSRWNGVAYGFEKAIRDLEEHSDA